MKIEKIVARVKGFRMERAHGKCSKIQTKKSA